MTKQYVYGIHAVSAAIQNPHRQISVLHISSERCDARLNDIVQQASARNIPIQALSEAFITQHLSGAVHQGVVACVGDLRQYNEQDIPTLLNTAKTPCLILILDGITDPHNLGACMRSADAAGVDFILIPKDKNAAITETVSKVASGAAESIPLVRVTNLVRVMKALKKSGVWIYGATGDAAQPIYAIDCKVSLALVMGAEGHGMRRLTREECDELFHLPMHGAVSSLNVSVATGVSLYEVIRQRSFQRHTSFQMQ